jgi:hypothetical protein
VILTRRAIELTALLLLAAGQDAHAQQMAYLPGMLLGRGYDAVSGLPKQDCINLVRENEPGPGALISQTYTMTEVTSNADIFSLTGIDASASFDTGLYSASAEMSLLSSTQISNFDANFLTEVSIERGWQYAKNVTLTPSARSLADSAPEAFRVQCGNRYVAGVLYGGEFYGLVAVSTSNQSERDDITAAVEGSYGPYSAEGAFTNKTMAALNSAQTSVKGFISGGSGQQLPLSMESMQSRMLAFPAEIMQSGGTPIKVLLLEYPLQAAPTTQGLYSLAMLRWEYVSAHAEIDYVVKRPEQFYMSLATWRPFLERLRIEAANAIAAVDRAASNCKQGTSACLSPSNLRSPDQMRGALPPRYVATCGMMRIDVQSTDLQVEHLNTKCGGDNEMGGHNPTIKIESSLTLGPMSEELDAFTTVTIREGKSDWTCFKNESKQYLANLAITYPGCFLESTLKASPSTGSLSARGGNDNHDWTFYSGGTGYVESASCLSDTNGSDRGKLGCRSIKLRPIQLAMDHDENRMGPNDLKRSAADSWGNRASVSRRVDGIIRDRSTHFRTSSQSYLQSIGLPPLQQQVVPRPTSVKTPKATFRTTGPGTLPTPR